MRTILATMILCGWLAAPLGAEETGEYEDISIADLKEAMAEKKVILLDVNGTKYFAKGHIPGAIDFRANEDKLAKVLADHDKSTLIVAYCGGPKCEAFTAGVEAVKALGFTNVKHLSVGISGWIGAGEETGRLDKKKS
ncbi:MAG: rhodanese-like domain-containing protein [Verrucomicrobiales bacterium]|nr:rhodanese-like domain-containing protein [Verrucomicrobiales bacterium]